LFSLKVKGAVEEELYAIQNSNIQQSSVSNTNSVENEANQQQMMWMTFCDVVLRFKLPIPPTTQLMQMNQSSTPAAEIASYMQLKHVSKITDSSEWWSTKT